MFESPKLTEKLPRKFLDSLRSVLFQSKIFGVVTFKQTENNLEPSQIRTFVNILAILIYLPAISYAVYEITTEEDSLIYKATDIIILQANVIYVATIWICGITKRDLFVEFLLKLIDFDVKLQTMGIKMNYKKSQKKILIQCLTQYGVLIVNISALLAIALTRNSNMTVESLAYFLLVINSVVGQSTTAFVVIFKARFKILNKQIHNLIEYFLKNNIKTVKLTTEPLCTLNKICALHHHLSKLIKLFNEIFGLILLLLFGVSFVVIVISFFYLTAALQKSKIFAIDVTMPFLTNATFIINIVYVCDVCYSTIEEANKAGELIHKIDTENHDMRDEIEMFSLQIANEQVEFNAAGFFPINYTLIFSIIGGVTTYIIILIQLAATLAD